jgi:hypothetical protein
MALPGGAAVHSTDWAPLESIVTKIVKEKQPFQRLVCRQSRAILHAPYTLTKG